MRPKSAAQFRNGAGKTAEKDEYGLRSEAQ
jgi:hypothetical protein